MRAESLLHQVAVQITARHWLACAANTLQAPFPTPVSFHFPQTTLILPLFLREIGSPVAQIGLQHSM